MTTDKIHIPIPIFIPISN